MPPRISTFDFTWSARWSLSRVLSDVPDAVREAAFEPALERVVPAVADGRDQPRLPGPAELLVQLPSGFSAANRRPVQLAEPELIDLPGPDVGGLAHESPRQLFLNRGIP